jgi:WD40 repeat protein
MSPTIENLLKEAVDDLVQAVPHRPGLADVALRKAASRRRAARLAVAGGAAVAVATTIPLGAGIIGGPAPQPSPNKQTHASVPQQKQQLPVRTVTVDIDELKQGAPPAVPWAKDGDAYAGETRLAPPSEFHESPKVRKVEGGYAILAYGSNEKLYLLKNGQTTTLSDRSKGWTGSLIVSPDGTQVAWTTKSDTGDTANTVHLADAGSGEITLEKQTSGAILGGFLSGDRILLMLPQNGGRDEATAMWNLRDNTISPWGGYKGLLSIGDVSASGALAALESVHETAEQQPQPTPDRRQPGDNFELCTAVVDTATGKTLWKGCAALGKESRDLVPLVFSPDGRYVLASHNGNYVVADARTGKAGLTARIKAEAVRNVVWESGQSFVFTAWKDNHRSAMVRCTITGKCELASPVTAFKPGRDKVEHEGYWPYSTLR